MDKYWLCLLVELNGQCKVTANISVNVRIFMAWNTKISHPWYNISIDAKNHKSPPDVFTLICHSYWLPIKTYWAYQNRTTSKYSLIKHVYLSNKMHSIWNINIDQAFDQEVLSCAISNIIQHIRIICQSFQQIKNRRSKAEISQIYYWNSKNHVKHELFSWLKCIT